MYKHGFYECERHFHTKSKEQTGDSQSSKKIELKTTQELLDYFYDDLLPTALQCGMTPNEFWYDEPRLLQSYIKKRELELDNINYVSWLIGLYVHQGVAVVIHNAFSDKSSKKSTYFEKPLDFFSEKKDKITNKQDMNTKYQAQHNYWAKFGKKGV